MKTIKSTILSIGVLGFLLAGYVVAKCLVSISELDQEVEA